MHDVGRIGRQVEVAHQDVAHLVLAVVGYEEHFLVDRLDAAFAVNGEQVGGILDNLCLEVTVGVVAALGQTEVEVIAFVGHEQLPHFERNDAVCYGAFDREVLLLDDVLCAEQVVEVDFVAFAAHVDGLAADRCHRGIFTNIATKRIIGNVCLMRVAILP